MENSEFALSPMEGVTDFPVRVWFSLTSAPKVMATPFLRVTATYPPNGLPLCYVPELSVLRGRLSYEVVPQLMASDKEHFVRAAHQVLDVSRFVDLNCGCPAPTVVGHGAGSSVLQDPEEFGGRIRWIAERLGDKRLSVKMRTGFADDSRFDDLVAALSGTSLHHLTIHGRTKGQKYLGKADWQLIDAASRRLTLPVVGSGDINSLACFKERSSVAPNLKHFFIGRGALRNPWVFSVLRGELDQVSLCEKTTLYALAVLATLLESSRKDPNRLIMCVGELITSSPLGEKLEAWQDFFEKSRSFLGEPIDCLENLQFEKRTLGRIKMHWSYLRSSFQEEFFDPKILRAQTWSDLCLGISSVFSSYHSRTGLRQVPLSYRSELDWVYAGGRDKG